MIQVIVFIFLLQIAMFIIGGKINYKTKYKYNVIATILNILITIFMIKSNNIDSILIIKLIAICILLSIVIIDTEYNEIPNSYNVILFCLSIVYIYIQYKNNINILNNIICMIILFSIFLLFAVFTGALGGGDVKLIGAISLFFKCQFIYKFLMISFVTGAIGGFVLMILGKKKWKEEMPFGPYLVIAIILMLYIY